MAVSRNSCTYICPNTCVPFGFTSRGWPLSTMLRFSTGRPSRRRVAPPTKSLKQHAVTQLAQTCRQVKKRRQWRQTQKTH